MTDYSELVNALRCCTSSSPDDCDICAYQPFCQRNGTGRERIMIDATAAIEELQAEVTDKDYLIQQQTHEIQRLMDDVKRQQKKMIELAKKLPKRSQWTNLRISAEGTSSVECILCGATIHNGFTKEPNYCPNCGAKMEVQE